MRLRPIIVIFVCAFACFLLSCCSSGTCTSMDSDFQEAIIIRVVDGDTLVVDLQGVEEKVRMINIDAEESVNPDESKNTEAGVQASDFVKAVATQGKTVWLQREVSDRDKYGRLLRHVWLSLPDDPDDSGEVSTSMLDAIIVANGHAKAVDYPPDIRYSRLLRQL